MGDSFLWYIFRVKSGTEDIAVDYVKSEFKDDSDFAEVYVPHENENLLDNINVPVSSLSGAILKKNEKKGKKLLLGYVFIKMNPTESFLKKVLTIPNIYRIRQNSNEMLQVVTNEEIENIKQRIKNYDNMKADSSKILVGDFAHVKHGSLSGLKGTIKQIGDGKVVISVKMFGRMTEISVLVTQIVKVDKKEGGF